MRNEIEHRMLHKQGRSTSSSDVRLTPHFRSPVDIERLGKAFVAIALKQKPLSSNSKETEAEGN